MYLEIPVVFRVYYKGILAPRGICPVIIIHLSVIALTVAMMSTELINNSQTMYLEIPVVSRVYYKGILAPRGILSSHNTSECYCIDCHYDVYRIAQLLYAYRRITTCL